MNPSLARIAAAIVVYRPDTDILCALVRALAPQVDRIWVIDNGGLPAGALEESGGVEVIRPGVNLGIGGALALAADRAVADAFDFLVTFDQDSIPASDMIAQQLAAYRCLVAAGVRVGGVGPQIVDRRSGRRAPFIAPARRWLPVRRRVLPSSHESVEVEHLITSGLLAPVDVYSAVGPPRADFFIDYVDIEWSLRLRHFGYRLYGVGAAELEHAIGDRLIRVLGREMSVHSPLRHYYLVRNVLFLIRSGTAPVVWKISYLLLLLRICLVAVTLFPSRLERISMILRGGGDALCGRLGQFRADG